MNSNITYPGMEEFIINKSKGHNGFIEGINNQTKVIKRNAFGFKRFDRFRLKTLWHHQ